MSPVGSSASAATSSPPGAVQHPPEQRLPTVDVLKRMLQRLHPPGVLWISPEAPDWVITRPGLRVVITNSPRPDLIDDDLVWIEHDLTWLHIETVDALREALAGREKEIEVAWIDGHHALHVLLSHVRWVLRVNPAMVMVFDDVVPPDMDMAGQEWGASDWWVGEVWKLFAWLQRQSSPGLVRTYDTASTGMGLISGLSTRMAAGLDSEVIREDVADLIVLEDVLAALKPATGRDVTSDLRAAGLSVRDIHPQAYEFVSLDELRREAGFEVVNLALGGPYLRPPAERVVDLSGCDWPHHIDQPWLTELSTVAWMSLPPGTIVRGTLLIELDDRRLFAPRVARADITHAFTGQIREARRDEESASHFFSGLNWLPTGEPTIEDTPVTEVDGDTLFVTPDEWDNWGTWLLQTLPALVHAERIGFDGHVLCRVTKPWQRAFIEALAPRLAKSIIPHDVDHAYRINGRLHLVAQELRNLATTMFEREVFTEVVDRALHQRPDPTPERLFLSRLTHSRRNPHYRALINEDELIAELEPLGFAPVETEHLDVLDQIALFARAREIVGLGGAAIFNVVFCREGASILDIESSTTWVEGHANLFATSGIRYAIVFGQQLPEDLGPHARWRLPIKDTAQEVKAFFNL